MSLKRPDPEIKPARNERPTLTEEIRFPFFTNRRKDLCAATLKTWTPADGKPINLIDIRLYAMDKHGCNVPTRKGIALDVRRLRDLHNAISKALLRAQSLGLLDDADDEAP
jgi:hypothetical protein